MVDKLRDLGLIVIGYALANEQCKLEVLSAIDPSDLPAELRDVLEAIKERQGAAVWKFFDSRGAIPQNGITAVKAAMNAIHHAALQDEKNRIREQVAGACKIMNNSEFVDHVQSLLNAFKAKAGIQHEGT